MKQLTHDVIVCGHGLAGAVLVHHLKERGLTFHVFDQPFQGSASQAAAGLVNPISLRRDVLTWRAHEMLASATEFYRSMERSLELELWRPTQLIKIFPTPAEADQWQRAIARKETSGFVTNEQTSEVMENEIAAPHGYGIVHQCAWLDIRNMIKAQRAELIRTGSLTEQEIKPAEPRNTSDGIAINEISARWIIHCNGPFAKVNGLVPVKGEVLTVRIPKVNIKSIIHRWIIILPIGGELYKIGSTFQWNDVWSRKSPSGADHLMEKLSAIIPAPVEIIDHVAGVRPTSKDRRPLLGKIAAHQAVFNGLGSRGAMIAPWCAKHLIDHLFDHEPLDPEVDIDRFDD
ncbi:MAG: FAD-binding oxidoreductase [Bacteroidota bacterium]|nr:FAD-binding oxidoreductase [Bacteroidota bacterium]